MQWAAVQNARFHRRQILVSFQNWRTNWERLSGLIGTRAELGQRGDSRQEGGSRASALARPTVAQALKMLINSSSLSSCASTSAWVGGLETAQTSRSLNAQLSTLNIQHHAGWPTAPPRFDFSFQLSAFQLFRSLPQPLWRFVLRRPCSTPARRHKPRNALCPAPSQKAAIRGYLSGKSSEPTSDKANSALSPSSRPHCASSAYRRSQAMHASGIRASSAKRYRCGAQVATDQPLHCLSSQKLLASGGSAGFNRSNAARN